jgi:hypothetical protein
MDMVEAGAADMIEVAACITVPGMTAILVPEGAIAAPIAVHKGTVIAVIIAVIITGAAGGDVNPGRSGAGGKRQGRQNRGKGEFPHGDFLSQNASLPVKRAQALDGCVVEFSFAAKSPLAPGRKPA